MKNENPFTKIKTAVEYVGGLSAPSKMPCYSYSIPATECHIGKRLRHVEGSVCSKCYARKGRYRFSNVKDSLQRRFETLNKPYWVDAFVFLIEKRKMDFFRWHDSGDLQGMGHLEKIVEIAKRSPACKFWLPTKEIALIRDYTASGKTFPPNLTVRISGYTIDGVAPVGFAKNRGLCVASVSPSMSKVNCTAYRTNGVCGDCRACWDKNVFEIVYKKH